MGMLNIYDEIYENAKKHITEKSKYSPYVLSTPPQETKVFPLVIISEIDNTLQNENLDKSDQKFRVEYEVEIYATDKGSIPKQVIIQELKGLVNEVFDDHYGMYRRACIPTPNADRNVDRLYMRYDAIIDEGKKIYRR